MSSDPKIASSGDSYTGARTGTEEQVVISCGANRKRVYHIQNDEVPICSHGGREASEWRPLDRSKLPNYRLCGQCANIEGVDVA